MKPLHGVIAFQGLFLFVLLLWTTALSSQEIPKTYRLDEVTIHGGVNPAHRIIDSVRGHCHVNNPNSLDSYRYQVYDQMTIAPDGETGVAELDSAMKTSDLMIMETVSEVLFQAPDKHRQNVFATRMAGMKEQLFVYLGSELQSVSFYDETVQVFGTDYVNPISRNSEKRYFFSLDSVYGGLHHDSLYVISFYPYSDLNFNGIHGSMTVSDDGWAVQQIKASPVASGELIEVSIEHLYQKVEHQWFPNQQRARLLFPQLVVNDSVRTFPLVVSCNSRVEQIEVHPEIDKRAFSDIEIDILPEAACRDDAFWTPYRIDSLTERIVNTYHLVDSLTKGNDFLERALGFGTTLVNKGALLMGPFDLNIVKMFRLSAMRGFYAGVDLSTNNSFSRHIRFNGFGGYWTRLRDFDYGLGATWLMKPRYQMELGVKFAHVSSSMGEFGGFDEGGLLSEKAFRYTFYENVLVRGDQYEAFFNTRFARYFKAFVTFGHYNKSYHVQPSECEEQGRFTNAELKLRFAYGERFKNTMTGLESLGTDYPVLWISYQHSFKGFLGEQYEFDRYKLQMEKDFRVGNMGVSSVLLQAGYATEGCPVMESFNIMGSYERFGLYSPGCFATIRENEFFCDRFVALFLSHDFQGTLWSPNTLYFKPQLSLVTHLGWGDMKNGKSFPERNFETMEHGFFESGIVVHGLLSTPTVTLGAGLFYRYGAYALPSIWSNFALKWAVTMSL